MRGLLLLALLVAAAALAGGVKGVVVLWAVIALGGVVGGLFYQHRLLGDLISGELFSGEVCPGLTNTPLVAVRCPQCGHNLSSYSAGQCPTCGLAFQVVDE